MNDRENRGFPGLESDVLSRIRTLLGEQAAQEFIPLWHKWVSSGFISGQEFNGTGDAIITTSIELGDLQPNHRVLDVGCGIGRIALPLLRYLDGSGSYEGFDVAPSGVAWLRRYVTSRFPRFHFGVARHLYSGLYNPTGRREASCYTFPYETATFDSAIAVSVFTHMAFAGVNRYLAEIARVLKPQGRVLCTAYLLDADAPGKPIAEDTAIKFPYDFEKYRLRSVSQPESAVAFDGEYFVCHALAAGLHLRGPIQRGSWHSQRAKPITQDLLILEKTAVG